MVAVGPKPYSSHVTIGPNTMGRDFVVGDVHGMLEALKDMMSDASFDPSVDRIFSVGDLIDRGPDNIALLELLDESWFFAVRGNHEELLLSDEPIDRVRHQRYGGEWTVGLDEEGWAWCRERVSALPVAMTIEGPGRTTIGICHAEWPEKDWAKVEIKLERAKVREQMIWGRTRLAANRPQRDKTADLLLHGHTPVEAPKRLGDSLFIDTGCVYGGYLTFMTLEEALGHGQV